MAYIEAKKVGKMFWEKYVLGHVYLSLEKGECLCIVGPNGSGKSTLLRLLSGLVKESEGEITIDGKHYPKQRPLISPVFEEPLVYRFYSSMDNAEFFVDFFGGNWKKKKNECFDLLYEFGLDDHKGKHSRNLSTGMQRKLDLVRALLLDRECLMLDEPDSTLDGRAKKTLVRLLEEKKKKGTTIVFVTHFPTLYTDIVDKLLILKDGQPILFETKENINKMWEVGKRVLILKTTNRFKVKEVLEGQKGVEQVKITQRAAHVVLEDDVVDVQPILAVLGKHNIGIKKILFRENSLDKFVSEYVTKH